MTATEAKDRVAEVFQARTPKEDTAEGWAALALRLETAARRSAGSVQRDALVDLASDAWERSDALRRGGCL